MMKVEEPKKRYEKPKICNDFYIDQSDQELTVFPLNLLRDFPYVRVSFFYKNKFFVMMILSTEEASIQMVYLASNNIEVLPGEIFTHLKHLQWLDVRSNLLESIPTAIKWHSSLETLLIQDNRIESLPLELCKN